MLAGGAILLITCAARPRAPRERWTVADRTAQWKVHGMSAAVIRDGKLAWAKGYGFLQARGAERVDVDAPGAQLPTLPEALDGRAPARNQPIRVTQIPGPKIRYSGGGTQIEQPVIEEITGSDFAAAARKYGFDPLGMSRSTYENPSPGTQGNIAEAHGADGIPSDYAKLVIAIMPSYHDSGANGSELDAEVRDAVAIAEGGCAAVSGFRSVPAITLSASGLAQKAGVYEVLTRPTHP